MKVRARLGAGIADGGAVAHIARTRERAAAGEETFKQRGLAALEGADQGDQARPRELVCRWMCCPSSCAPLRERRDFPTNSVARRRCRQGDRFRSCKGPQDTKCAASRWNISQIAALWRARDRLPNRRAAILGLHRFPGRSGGMQPEGAEGQARRKRRAFLFGFVNLR